MGGVCADMQEPTCSVAARRPDLPSALDGVIATALAKRKDDRFPSASSFAAPAAAAMDRGAVAQPPSLAVRSPQAQAPPAPTAPAYPTGTPPPEPPEPPRRERSLTGVALVVAALLVAGGGTAAVLIITGKKDKPVPATPAAAKTQTITTTVPTPEPPVPAPPENRPTPAPHAQRALGERWKAIENQDFASAYDYIDPSVFPDRTSW